MKLDVLAIAAHPDDVELTCGGTLIKMASRGYRTGILDLTRGEMGTRGTPEIRAREAKAAAKILGVKVRENLGLPDSRLEVNEEYKLELARMIRELQPHTVILPYWEGRHPDHYNAGRLGYEGCFLAGLKRMPIGGEAFRPYKIIYSAAYEGTVRANFRRGYHRGVRADAAAPFWLTNRSSRLRQRRSAPRFTCRSTSSNRA